MTDEAEAWYSSVYMTVQLIPPGHVTTYGHIAFLIGRRKPPTNTELLHSLNAGASNTRTATASRYVGTALKHLPLPSEDTIFNSETVPWQRVVNASAKISDRGDGGLGKRRQVEVLREEGVVVRDLGGGEFKVDFRDVGWFPEELPDEEEGQPEVGG